jgi:uncharacterized paraquat-inducible protein A
MDPVLRPKTIVYIACILAPFSTLFLLARLHVRIRIQRNAGWDDWLMVAALVSQTGTFSSRC